MIDNALTTSGWYQSLVDDLTAIYTEGIFTARWEVIKCYHGVGERIITDEDYQRYASGNGKLLSRVSEATNISERDLYRAMQFYNLYPDLNKLPDGKNISWHKIVNNLLPCTSDKPGRTFQQRVSGLETSLGNLLNDYPDNRDDIINTIWRVIGGEWR